MQFLKKYVNSRTIFYAESKFHILSRKNEFLEEFSIKSITFRGRFFRLKNVKFEVRGRDQNTAQAMSVIIKNVNKLKFQIQN